MKRKLNILVALCLLVACVVVFVSASTSLTYWYSISTNTPQDSIDSDTIGCWLSSPSVYLIDWIKMETGINGAHFANSVQTGIDSWNDALDIDISITNSQNAAGILYYFGNAEEIEEHDYFTLVEDTSGNTAIVTKTPKEQFTWSGNVKVGYQIHPIVYSAVVNCGLNQNETRKTATHELGHALGYFGHDTYYPTGGTMSVMTKGRSSDYTLNSRDICHLKQIYDLIKARGEFQ